MFAARLASLIAVVTTLIQLSAPADAASIQRVRYPHISEPHPAAGRALRAWITLQGETLRLQGVASALFPKGDETIKLNVHESPKHLQNYSNPRLVMINGKDSIAILPGNPRPGDAAAVIPKDSVYGVYPVNRRFLSARDLERLNHAIGLVKESPDPANLERAASILNETFDKAKTPEVNKLREADPQNVRFDRVFPLHGLVELAEMHLRPNDSLARHIVLRRPSRDQGNPRRQGVDVLIQEYISSDRGLSGTETWLSHTLHLTRRTVLGNPELLEAVFAARSMLEIAKANAPNITAPNRKLVNGILRRLKNILRVSPPRS